jgi:hypothetical protein
VGYTQRVTQLTCAGHPAAAQSSLHSANAIIRGVSLRSVALPPAELHALQATLSPPLDPSTLARLVWEEGGVAPPGTRRRALLLTSSCAPQVGASHLTSTLRASSDVSSAAGSLETERRTNH